MKNITLLVREVHQTRSYDHVVIFDAEVEIIPDTTTVDIQFLGSYPNGDDEAEVMLALENIREGVVAVLEPQGLGAFVVVSRLLINIIDFQPRQYQRYTMEYLTEALANATN